jgi:hypothetical protein
MPPPRIGISYSGSPNEGRCTGKNRRYRLLQVFHAKVSVPRRQQRSCWGISCQRWLMTTQSCGLPGADARMLPPGNGLQGFDVRHGPGQITNDFPGFEKGGMVNQVGAIIDVLGDRNGDCALSPPCRRRAQRS